jgi:hypothetical protein
MVTDRSRCGHYLTFLSLFSLFMPPAPITNVEAIEGQQAHLYCPMTTPTADKINMVLWFKDDVGVPIYRWVQHIKRIKEGLSRPFSQLWRSREVNERCNDLVRSECFWDPCQIQSRTRLKFQHGSSIPRDRCELISLSLRLSVLTRSFYLSHFFSPISADAINKKGH